MTKCVATLAFSLTLTPPTPSLLQVWWVPLPQFIREPSGVGRAWKLGQGFLGYT